MSTSQTLNSQPAARRALLLAFTFATLWTPAFAQSNLFGSAVCTATVNGNITDGNGIVSGHFEYSGTETWTMTGGMPTQGVTPTTLDYPATWTVSGSGSYQRISGPTSQYVTAGSFSRKLSVYTNTAGSIMTPENIGQQLGTTIYNDGVPDRLSYAIQDWPFPSGRIPSPIPIEGSSQFEWMVGEAGYEIVAQQPTAPNLPVTMDCTWHFGYFGASLQLVTVIPCRILDTRNPNGTFGGPFIAGGTSRTVPIPSSTCGIPANASAYSLNITVVPRDGGTLGYLTVWPTGQSQPNVSTLNSPDGSTLANAAIVPAGTSGSIDAFALNDTDLIVDVNGYFVPPAAGTLQFYPLTPCRVLDTRNPNGTFGGPSIAGGTSRSFPIPSSGCGAPANAAAFSFNVTAVPQGFLGYLTAYPDGESLPNVSTLNSLDGTILANAAIVPAGTAGAVSLYAANTTDVVVDINGYFAAPAAGGLNFVTSAPCRVVDTRNPNGTLGGPIMDGNTTRTFPLPTSSCGLPPTAAAYSLNMTVVPSGPLGFLTTWPTGQSQPNASTLNAPKGLVVANAAIVPAGTNGSIDVYVVQTTHVVIDVNGYFQ